MNVIILYMKFYLEIFEINTDNKISNLQISENNKKL